MILLILKIIFRITDKNDQGMIDEKEPLTDNGTILKFQASSKFITLSTFNNNQNAQTVFENKNSIEYKPLCEPLSSFINTKREFKQLDAREDITIVNGKTVKKIVEVNRYTYKKNNAITIRCSGEVLKKMNTLKLPHHETDVRIKRLGLYILVKILRSASLVWLKLMLKLKEKF